MGGRRARRTAGLAVLVGRLLVLVGASERGRLTMGLAFEEFESVLEGRDERPQLGVRGSKTLDFGFELLKACVSWVCVQGPLPSASIYMTEGSIEATRTARKFKIRQT